MASVIALSRRLASNRRQKKDKGISYSAYTYELLYGTYLYYIDIHICMVCNCVLHYYVHTYRYSTKNVFLQRKE